MNTVLHIIEMSSHTSQARVVTLKLKKKKEKKIEKTHPKLKWMVRTRRTIIILCAVKMMI